MLVYKFGKTVHIILEGLYRFWDGGLLLWKGVLWNLNGVLYILNGGYIFPDGIYKFGGVVLGHVAECLVCLGQAKRIFADHRENLAFYIGLMSRIF